MRGILWIIFLAFMFICGKPTVSSSVATTTITDWEDSVQQKVRGKFVRGEKMKNLHGELDNLRLIVSKLQEEVEALKAAADKRRAEGRKFKMEVDELKTKMEDGESRKTVEKEVTELGVRVKNLEDRTDQEKKDVETLKYIVNALTQKQENYRPTLNLSRNHDPLLSGRVQDLESIAKYNSDRIHTFQNEWMTQKNSTGILFNDYCARTLKGGHSDSSTVNEAFDFCVNKVNFNLSTIPTRRLLGDIISKPRARLYAGANLTGNSEDFNAEEKSNPKCLDLRTVYEGVESLETFGTCVRLYTVTDCWGRSMAFFPQPSSSSPSSSSKAMDPPKMSQKINFKGVKSVGPCFENELDESHIEVSPDGTKGYEKLKGRDDVPFVPDLITIGHESNYKKTNSSPIIWYRTGYGGRVEYIRADIRLTDIEKEKGRSSIDHDPSSQENVNGTNQSDPQFYSQLEQQKGDKLGHFIGISLGPQSNLPFHNVFPQGPRNRKLMTKLEKEIVDKIALPKNVNKTVGLYINVHYKSGPRTRPTGMIYWITLFNEFRYLSNQRANS